MTDRADTAGPARAEILGRVRSALGKNAGGGRQDAAALEAGMTTRRPQVRPCIPSETIALFKDKAAANLMSVRSLAGMADVPAAVAAILAAGNMAPDISIAPALSMLAWPSTITWRSAKARIDEKLTVSLATAGIAETGSLVLCSNEGAPSSLSYAAEVHVIVIEAGKIVGYLEEGLAAVKRSEALWPRAVNLVSGPSRTADVAGIVVRPAHGPKAVHLLIIEPSV